MGLFDATSFVRTFAIYDSVTPVELNRLILLINPSAPNGAVHVYKHNEITMNVTVVNV